MSSGGEMPAELRHDAAGVERQRAHAARGEAPVELDGEEHVRGLGLAVGAPLVIGAALEVDVVEHDARELVAGRAHRDDAGGRRGDERRRERVPSRKWPR